MHKTVTIHSFRQSVGKSSLAANLACLLALQGRRVALVDTDFHGPSAHLFFGLQEEQTRATFNDYLQGVCAAPLAAHDLTESLGIPTEGRLFLVPSSTRTADIMQMLRSPLNLERYTEGLAALEKELNLDTVLVDTRAGINENTLALIAVTHTLLLVLRPDQQDFQGTAVSVDLARRLQVPHIHLVLNDASPLLSPADVSQQLEDSYHCGGGFVLPHSEELLALASRRPFVLAYPEHPLTARIQALSAGL